MLKDSTKVINLPSTKKIHYKELDFDKILKHSIYTDPVTNKRTRLSDILKGVKDYGDVVQQIQSENIQVRPTDVQQMKARTSSMYGIMVTKTGKTISSDSKPTAEERYTENLIIINHLKNQYLAIADSITDENARETIKRYIEHNIKSTDSMKGTQYMVNYYTDNVVDFSSKVSAFNDSKTNENFYQVEKVIDRQSSKSMYLLKSKPIDFESEPNAQVSSSDFMNKPIDTIELPGVNIPIEIDDNDEPFSWYPTNDTTTKEYDKPTQSIINTIDEYTSKFLKMLDEIRDYRYIKITGHYRHGRRSIAYDFTEIKEQLKSMWYDLVIDDNDETLEYIKSIWEDVVDSIKGVAQDSEAEVIEGNYSYLEELITRGHSNLSVESKMTLSEMSEMNG